jgi:hypothetical protein
MTLRYVGPGGSNANDGLSWANRKLTLTSVESIPVAAGDTVYVGPGVYRENLICGVSGSAGNPITYIGDVTGEHTDGVGGAVRITGSDNDQTAQGRSNCINATSRNYRTFRGFLLDTGANQTILTNPGGSDLTIEDCVLQQTPAAVSMMLLQGAATNVTIRRCLFLGGAQACITFSHTSTVDNAGHLIENCVFIGASQHILITRVGGITVRHCTFFSGTAAVRVNAALAAGQTTLVRNCIMYGVLGSVLMAVTAPATNEEITEDYNALTGCGTLRSNVTTGANSITDVALFAPPLLTAGLLLPAPVISALSSWSTLARKAGTGMAAGDFFGLTRPADSKKSWGALQYTGQARETTTVHTALGASLKLADAGRTQMFVPTEGTEITLSVYVYREADYAGTLPQMVIKQPGQSDITVVDTGAASGWNLLTHTFTPAATPGYVVVELVSNNTAVAGNYDCFFDDLSAA